MFAVETLLPTGWQNIWTTNGLLLYFSTAEEAQETLDDFLKRGGRFVRASDFRIVEVQLDQP